MEEYVFSFSIFHGRLAHSSALVDVAIQASNASDTLTESKSIQSKATCLVLVLDLYKKKTAGRTLIETYQKLCSIFSIEQISVIVLFWWFFGACTHQALEASTVDITQELLPYIRFESNQGVPSTRLDPLDIVTSPWQFLI